MKAPVLETPRLILRPHAVSDFETSYALWSDPRTVRFIGGNPSTPDRAWARMLTYAGLWALTGFGYWAVCERASERHIGDVGFGDFRRDIDPGFAGEPEMGWVLSPDSHGRGYATEAVTAALAWADAALPHRRVVCMIENGNDASVNVAQKCGFRDWTPAVFNGVDVRLFLRLLEKPGQLQPLP